MAARQEEAAFHRAELDAVKKENEMLRQRIRELEGQVRGGSSRESGRVSDDLGS
jgi:cell division septum initiation protein DivIVA